MCGIFGTINHPVAPDAVIARLRHRGPDESGVSVFERVQLLHLRLAIQAITCGTQPMHLGERYTIVYNGEIYNNDAVIRELGLQCETPSDTETLLRAFAKTGFAALDAIDGMFAFAILDREERKIHFARDRAGKKPLYFYNDGKRFAFSSELNALRSALPLRIDESAIRTALRFGYNVGTQTPYLNVSELAPGHRATVDLDDLSLRTEPWWKYNSGTRAHGVTEAQALTDVDDMLRVSVERRMSASDLTVGCFLSGGIDSGLITALAAERQPGLPTFTISFPGAYDESALAEQVSRRYQTRHHNIPINFDSLPQEIETIVTSTGEPLYDSSLIPSYYVSRAAREHVTVVLNGDGADELFGGYRRYVPFRYLDFWKPESGPVRMVDKLVSLLPKSTDKRSLVHQLHRLARMSDGSTTEVYLKATTDIFEGTEFVEHLPLDLGISSSINGIVARARTPLQALLDLDFRLQLPGDLLVKMDIATMAHSLEGRSPLLSRELLDYVPQLGDNLKIRGKNTKYLLRKLATRYLPEELINQPKRGFEIPLKDWTQGLLKDAIYDYLDADAYVSSIVPSRLIEQLKSRPDMFDSEKRAKMLWTLFCVEVWHRRTFVAADVSRQPPFNLAA